MLLMLIEQAVYGSQDAGGYRFLARSPGFLDEWLPAAQRLCTCFGERPAGVACPGCVFARPFVAGHVAVVQVADQGADDTGRPGALGFRLLVLPLRLYEDLGGDPFHIAEQYPAPWEARGDLPGLEWTAGAPPRRLVGDIQLVLNVPHSPTLLGGVQALVDGGRVVFERPAPAPELVRALWALLPTSSRCGLWPASFAFSNAHRFDALVVPRAKGPEYEYYVHERQAGDYPEGRYELNLQIAVEAGDQAAMDALFARRSRAQMVRMGVALLLVFLLVPLAVLLLVPSPKPDPRPPAPKKKDPPAKKKPAGAEKLQLDELPRLSDTESARLARRLEGLGKRLGVELPAEPSELADSLAKLDEALDRRVAKKLRREPGPLAEVGPPQQLLRALLWKHGVLEYNRPGLTPVELVDRLEKKLAEAGVLKESSGE
jgi:hypothetical protein